MLLLFESKLCNYQTKYVYYHNKDNGKFTIKNVNTTSQLKQTCLCTPGKSASKVPLFVAIGQTLGPNEAIKLSHEMPP